MHKQRTDMHYWGECKQYSAIKFQVSAEVNRMVNKSNFRFIL